MKLLILLGLFLFLPTDAHRHVYILRNHSITHHGYHSHGLDRHDRLIVSKRSKRERHEAPYLIDHGEKISGKLGRRIIVETAVDGREVLTNVQNWIPLTIRVQAFETGFVLSSTATLSWYLVNLLESHESVVAIHSLEQKFRPHLAHAMKVLFSPPIPTTVDFLASDAIVTIGDSGLDYQHCAFQPNSELRKYVYTGFNKAEIINSIQRDVLYPGKILAYIRLAIPPKLAETDFEDPIADGGHGTHVAGIVAGGDCVKRGGVNKMKMVVFDLMRSGDQYLSLPPFFIDLLEISYGSGSRVMTNSWGDLESGKHYSYTAKEMDRFLWDHDDYMIIMASGNDGAGNLHSPGHFKNGITVGAGLNSFSSWLEYIPHNPYVASNPRLFTEHNLFEFTSRGTMGGRIKPTLVAPGGKIMSAKSGGGLQLMSGTSMATPLLAWRYLHVLSQLPKNVSALVPMGILVASASSMADTGYKVELEFSGLRITDKIRPWEDGWGRLSGKASVRGWGWYDREGTPRKEFCFHAPHRGRQHTIVLLWRDIPNWVGGDGRLLIDYDLRVLVKGHGVLRLDDHANNIEKVTWRGGADIRAQVSLNSTVALDRPSTYTLIYSKGLKPVSCYEKDEECYEDTPALSCGEKRGKLCRNGKWSKQCVVLGDEEGTVVLNKTSQCYMSTRDKQCVKGDWKEWKTPLHKTRRKLANSISLVELATFHGELVNSNTYVIGVSVSVGAAILLVLVRWGLYR